MKQSFKSTMMLVSASFVAYAANESTRSVLSEKTGTAVSAPLPEITGDMLRHEWRQRPDVQPLLEQFETKVQELKNIFLAVGLEHEKTLHAKNPELFFFADPDKVMEYTLCLHTIMQLEENINWLKGQYGQIDGPDTVGRVLDVVNHNRGFKTLITMVKCSTGPHGLRKSGFSFASIKDPAWGGKNASDRSKELVSELDNLAKQIEEKLPSTSNSKTTGT